MNILNYNNKNKEQIVCTYIVLYFWSGSDYKKYSINKSYCYLIIFTNYFRNGR